MELHILNSHQNRSKNILVVKCDANTWKLLVPSYGLSQRKRSASDVGESQKGAGMGDTPCPPFFPALLKGNGEDCYAGYTCIIHTYGSKTSLEMYSFGILGSWYENTFCNPTNQRSVCFEGCLLNELPTTWNSITPLLSSQRAASSLALWVPGYSPPWNS